MSLPFSNIVYKKLMNRRFPTLFIFPPVPEKICHILSQISVKLLQRCCRKTFLLSFLLLVFDVSTSESPVRKSKSISKLKTAYKNQNSRFPTRLNIGKNVPCFQSP